MITTEKVAYITGFTSVVLTIQRGTENPLDALYVSTIGSSIVLLGCALKNPSIVKIGNLVTASSIFALPGTVVTYVVTQLSGATSFSKLAGFAAGLFVTKALAVKTLAQIRHVVRV